MSRSTDPAALFHLLRSGDRAALAQAITLVESTLPSEQDRAEELLERCLPFAQGSLRIGITGPPGVGKSTLIDAFGMLLIGQGHRVAVLAVDPSSQQSGGSILGDKTRMERLGAEAAAFIRPTATRGSLGGVARRTREAMVLCQAAGYDRILIETVGVGQSELDVDHLSDLNVLLTLPGAGDELQGIKRGIMESADLIVVTKNDGANADRAKAASVDLQLAVQLLPPRIHGGRAEVLTCSAVTGEGLDVLLDRIGALHERFQASGHMATRRAAQESWWMHRTVEEGLLQAFRTHPTVIDALPAVGAEVEAGRISPFKAARQLLDLFLPARNTA